MARGTQRPPERPAMTVDQRLQVIDRLRKRISALELFDPSTLTARYGSPEVEALEASIRSTLGAAFGNGTPEFNQYSRAADLDQGPHTMRTGFDRGPRREDMPEVFQGFFRDGRTKSIALLNAAVETLEEELPSTAPALTPTSKEHASNRKVFVVHGHDEGAREIVARFLMNAEFTPIILHEQANQGRTVIEKIVEHGDVGFAVVLLTPDDMGAAKGQTNQARARQNVLLELGYFIGRLGRERVCALKKGDLELPSDFGGVVYEAMDAGNGWKLALGRELKAAGYAFSFDKALS